MCDFSISCIVTSKCNESCVYCDFPIVNNPTDMVDFNDFKYYVDFIKHIDKDLPLSIVGGEPGLLETDTISKMINFLNNYSNITWYSNGLLLNKIDFLNLSIHPVVVHILDKYLLRYTYIIHKNLNYVIVLTNDNKDICSILKKSNIFKNKNVKLKLVSGVRNNININLTRDLIVDKKLPPIDCNKSSLMFSIDFTENIIKKCCRRYLNNIDKKLSVDNLLLALDGKLFPMFDDTICGKCNFNRIKF